MSYTPTAWVDGVTPVNAENLNKMETGIKSNSDAIDEINTARENGEFNGKDGDSGVYVGPGEMPEGYAVQIDPTGDNPLKDFIKSINGATPDENGNVNIKISDQAQPDWNAEEGEPGHVLNRTHYKGRMYDDIVYDGNNEGRDVVDLTALFGAEVYGYKVSDQILTKNHYENSTMIRDTTEGNSYEYSLEYVAGGEDGDPYVFYASYFFSSIVMAIASVSVAGEIDGIVFPSTGTYIAVPMWDQEKFAKVTITSKDATIPLDEEFIPKSIARTSEVNEITQAIIQSINTQKEEQDTAIKNMLYGILVFEDDTEVPYRGFIGNPLPRRVFFPNATVVKEKAFYGCPYLREAHFDVVENIQSEAFKNCTSLLDIECGTKLRNIHSGAFAGCTSLEALWSDSDIYEIGEEAFSGCENLIRLNLTGVTSICKLGTNALYGTPLESGNGAIVVSYAMVDAYKADPEWSKYADIISGG